MPPGKRPDRLGDGSPAASDYRYADPLGAPADLVDVLDPKHHRTDSLTTLGDQRGANQASSCPGEGQMISSPAGPVHLGAQVERRSRSVDPPSRSGSSPSSAVIFCRVSSARSKLW